MIATRSLIAYQPTCTWFHTNQFDLIHLLTLLTSHSWAWYASCAHCLFVMKSNSLLLSSMNTHKLVPCLLLLDYHTRQSKYILLIIVPFTKQTTWCTQSIFLSIIAKFASDQINWCSDWQEKVPPWSIDTWVKYWILGEWE